MPARAEYVAQRTIEVNGIPGYQAGDEVYASVVENLGLSVGSDGDVLPLQGTLLPKPGKGAKRGEWVAYALSQGVSQDDIDAMTVADLAAFFEDDDGEAAGSE